MDTAELRRLATTASGDSPSVEEIGAWGIACTPARILAMLDVIEAAEAMVAAEESDADSYWEALDAGKAALANLSSTP